MRTRHEEEIQNRLKRLNERKLHIQECKVQKVKATDASLGDTDNSGIVSDKGNNQSLENQSNTSGNESSRSRNECNDKSTSGDDTYIRPSYDTESMVEIQKQLKKANASLTQELKECKSTLEVTNKTLGESNSTRDSCLIALQNKQAEIEKYKAFNDRTIDYDILERKLKETQAVLAQKEHDIKEGLDLKAYEISVVKEKHDALVKQSLLTKSSYEGLVKEKNKIPYDTSDLANRFTPDREETLTLEQKSRSKLNKDLVKPYDYTKQNSLYEIFKPASQEYHDQLAHATEVRKKMWRKSFVKSKAKNFKNIGFLPTSKSIRKSRQAYNVMTNNINHFRELVEQAWEKHSHDQFRAPTTHDMEVLIKTCLMPLALKIQNDSFRFVSELKQKMHADLKYAESLEKEINELESDITDFSNMYDLLLQECVSNDVMCSYLHSLADLDAHTELQCLYQLKIKECKCLAEKLSKQTKTQCQEQMKNDTVCKEKESTVFLKEHEQYFEIQYLKAQLQDKNIAISELKKVIEKIKEKSVDTNFEKQSILGKLPLQPIRNQPVVRQPIAKSSFAKPYDVNAPGPSRNSPKHVSFQSPRESVGSNDMVHNYYLEVAKKKTQLQKDKALNTKPSMQQSARLPNTVNGNKLKPRNFNQQPRNWPPSMSSRVSNRTVNIAEPPRNQKPFLKSKDLACPTCKKCIYSANHDECILKYLSKVHSRASAQKKDAQSHKTTKRYMPVEKKCDSKKHDRQIPIGQKFSPNKSSNVYLKTTPPRSGLTWKPTGRIFTQVGLKWIPIRKPVETRYNTNDSASPLGKETHNPKTVICANSSSLSAGTSMASEPISSKGSSNVWICQISQEISQKRTRERMSDQEAKDLKAEAREIMPQPSTVNCKKPQSKPKPISIAY
ncbi:hypothetical protein Tco_0791718 [Tanacetum coccineum]